MTAQLMDGTALAASLYAEVADRAAALETRTGRRPCLATVLVGQDPASHTYVRMKQNRCAQVGVASRRVDLPVATTTAALVRTIEDLSDDDGVDGILLQHPAPAHVDERVAFEAIAPGKDVDGVTVQSFGAMAFGLPGFHSCTPAGILRLLDHHEVPLAGARVVVVGRSAILGRPVAMLALARDATVTVCHSRTRDLAAEVGRADVVIAAVGVPGLVRGGWLRPGCVVVDAGYHPGNIGDVEAAGALDVARLVTPVPGGVGPMTIAVLLEQTVRAAEMRTGTPGMRRPGASG